MGQWGLWKGHWGTPGSSVRLTLLASLWYFTAFLVSATARSTKPTDWSMLFSMRSIMVPYGAWGRRGGGRERQRETEGGTLRAPRGAGTHPPCAPGPGTGVPSWSAGSPAPRARPCASRIAPRYPAAHPAGTGRGDRLNPVAQPYGTWHGPTARGTAPRHVAQPHGAGTHPSPVHTVAPRIAWGGTERG